MRNLFWNIFGEKLANNISDDISISINYKQSEMNISLNYNRDELDLDNCLDEILEASIPGEKICGKDEIAGLNVYYSAFKLYNELHLFRSEILNTHEIKVMLIKKLTDEILFTQEMFKIQGSIHESVFKYLKIKTPKEHFIEGFSNLKFEYSNHEKIHELYDGDVITFNKKIKNGYQEISVVYPNYNGWDEEEIFSSLEIDHESIYSWIDFFNCLRTNIKDYVGFDFYN